MTDRNLYMGVDPGASGGLAVLDSAGGVVDVSPMPATERDVSDYIAEFGPRVRHAVIESVHAMPKQGVSSTFKFGVSYGGLRMALIANGVPFESVTPGVWQRSMGCLRRNKSEGNSEHKNRTKARAQELFPRARVTHAIADALLLAEHCRRAHR